MPGTRGQNTSTPSITPKTRTTRKIVERDEEQDLRDAGRADRDVREPEHAGHDRDQKEDDCPFEHVLGPPSWCISRLAAGHRSLRRRRAVPAESRTAPFSRATASAGESRPEIPRSNRHARTSESPVSPQNAGDVCDGGVKFAGRHSHFSRIHIAVVRNGVPRPSARRGRNPRTTGTRIAPVATCACHRVLANSVGTPRSSR